MFLGVIPTQFSLGAGVGSVVSGRNCLRNGRSSRAMELPLEWVDRLCGGRLISNPLGGGIIKMCRL